jgi:N-sulfoglucosamine sulfohydrolase
MRRKIDSFLILLILLAALPAYPAARNVLLIISDDQGLDLAAYGNEVVRTPHIDMLAGRGTLFTHAFATVSSCSPSRSVILTGLYSHSNGVYGLAHDVHNQHLLPAVRTLPQLLKASGYRTGLVGKKHIVPDSSFPFHSELAPEQPGNRDVAFMAAEAGRFMSADAARPFFLVVGYSDPHRAPQNFGNTQDWPQVKRQRYEPSQVIVPAHLPDVPEVRQDLAHYYESVSRLDSGIGLLLDALRAAGREGDTLVIYLSDNGRAFPRAKTTLYDDGIRLPLVIALPGAKQRGVRSEAMVSWIDIAPTILDWAKSAGPKEYRLPGRSLLPILGETTPKGWERIFASHGFHEIQQYYPMRALRTREHKYILNLAHPLSFPIAGDVASSPSWAAFERTPALRAYLQRPREELYDLTNDPHETKNLATDAEYRDVLEGLRTQLAVFRKETRDPWLPGQVTVHDHRSH